MDAFQGTLGERNGTPQPPNAHAVLDVFACFTLGQCFQVEAGNDPLCQLLQLRARDHLPQFGLADQDHLQQLALWRLQVGEQAQLLQHVGCEVLRLIDDEDVLLAFGVARQQVFIERIEVILDGGGSNAGVVHRYLELVADGLEEIGDRQLRVEDVGHPTMLGHLLQETSADGGLASADFAAEQDEPTAAPDAIEKMCESLPVALTHEEVVRVGSD